MLASVCSCRTYRTLNLQQAARQLRQDKTGELPTADFTVSAQTKESAGKIGHEIDLGSRGETERKHADCQHPPGRIGHRQDHAAERTTAEYDARDR